MWTLIITVLSLLILSAGVLCFYIRQSNKKNLSDNLPFESSCFRIDLKYQKLYFYDSFLELNTNELQLSTFYDLLDADTRAKFKKITNDWINKKKLNKPNLIVKFLVSDLYYIVTFYKLLPKENIVIGKISAYWNFHNKLLINDQHLNITNTNDNLDIFNCIKQFHNRFLLTKILIIVYQFNFKDMINIFLTPEQTTIFNQKILYFFKKYKIFWNKITNHFIIICPNYIKLYFINLQIQRFIKKLLFEESIDINNNVIFKSVWVTLKDDFSSFLAKYEYLLIQHHHYVKKTTKIFNILDNSKINDQEIINLSKIKLFFHTKTTPVNKFDFFINNIFAISNLLNIKMFYIFLNNMNNFIDIMNNVFDKKLVKQFLNYFIQNNHDWQKNYTKFLKHVLKSNNLLQKEKTVLLPLFLNKNNYFYATSIMEVTNFVENQLGSLINDKLNVALLINGALLKTGSLEEFVKLLTSIKSLNYQSVLLLNNDLLEKFFGFLWYIKNLDMVMLDVKVVADLLVNDVKRIILAKLLTKLKDMKILVIANFNNVYNQSILYWLINYEVSFVNMINVDKQTSTLIK